MYNFFLSHLYWFWLAVLAASIVVEACTFSLTTIWAAISALFMIFLSISKMPFRWQLIIFLVMTILLMIFTRPFAMKKLKLGKNTTNVNTMTGQEVLVTKAVSKFQKGEAKAKNGVLWTVKSFDDSEIPENTVCIITEVDGNTLTIKPKS